MTLIGTIGGRSAPGFERVAAEFERNFSERGDIGAAVAVTVGGEFVVDLWGGHADAVESRPWERDTLVNVYSTTKGMTALCAHMLVDRGELDLDEPGGDLLAGVRGGGQGVDPGALAAEPPRRAHGSPAQAHYRRRLRLGPRT